MQGATPSAPVGALPPRARRPWRAAAVRTLVYGGALFVAIPWPLSSVLLRTYRQPVGPPPAGYEEQRVVADGLQLRTWLRRGDPARAAVLITHGLGDSLETFVFDADRLARDGHSVLLLDLRGHGGSQDAPCTLGAREQHDVRAGLELLRREGLAGSGVALIGHSLGAVAVLLAAADRPDVRAVVVEAPFDSYRETTYHHARLYYGLPRWLPLTRLAVAAAEWRAGFDADDVDTVAAARRIAAPLLLIVDGGDARMPEAVVRRVFDAHAAAHPGRTTLWVAAGAPHCGAWMDAGYWPRIFAFLDTAGV